jgi:hypothetical protein
LKGQVVLDHGLGKMQADRATLQKQESGKDFPFSLIHLEKGVILSLKSQGELKCDIADFDFISMKGKLQGEERVSYTDLLKRKKGPDTPFEMSSHSIDLSMTKKDEKYDISVLSAVDHVLVTYANSFTLHADRALFKKESKMLSAMPNDGNLCKLSYLAGEVLAEAVSLDMNQSHVGLKNPKGTFQNLKFSALSMLWDMPRSSLILQGNVLAEDPLVGTINASDELHIIHTKNKDRVSAIKTKGKTVLHDLNHHELLCYGSILIDREKFQAQGLSPTVDGHVPEGEQIRYEENDMIVFADNAHLEYAKDFHPVSVALKGNIKILSKQTEGGRKCGLADRVTYIPTTRTFILGADPGKKVLFANDEDGLRISAQEIHITEDPSTKKQSVKGIGSVQLSLSTDELTLLDQLLKIPLPAQ